VVDPERLTEPIALEGCRELRVTREIWGGGGERLHARIWRDREITTAGLNLPSGEWRLLLPVISAALKEDRRRRWAKTAAEARRFAAEGFNKAEIAVALAPYPARRCVACSMT
jgi:hypothetical protein